MHDIHYLTESDRITKSHACLNTLLFDSRTSFKNFRSHLAFAWSIIQECARWMVCWAHRTSNFYLNLANRLILQWTTVHASQHSTGTYHTTARTQLQDLVLCDPQLVLSNMALGPAQRLPCCCLTSDFKTWPFVTTSGYHITKNMADCWNEEHRSYNVDLGFKIWPSLTS